MNPTFMKIIMFSFYWLFKRSWFILLVILQAVTCGAVELYWLNREVSAGQNIIQPVVQVLENRKLFSFIQSLPSLPFSRLSEINLRHYIVSSGAQRNIDISIWVQTNSAFCRCLLNPQTTCILSARLLRTTSIGMVLSLYNCLVYCLPMHHSEPWYQSWYYKLQRDDCT